METQKSWGLYQKSMNEPKSPQIRGGGFIFVVDFEVGLYDFLLNNVTFGHTSIM